MNNKFISFEERFLQIRQIYVNRDVDKAISMLKEILRIDARNYIAYKDLISIYFREHQYEKALEKCNEMLRFFPNDYWVYYYRGNIYMGLDKLFEAKTDYEKAYSLNHNHPETCQNLANIFYVLEKEAIIKGYKTLPEIIIALDKIISLSNEAVRLYKKNNADLKKYCREMVAEAEQMKNNLIIAYKAREN
ncbi:MAG: tetratricopeptide repeat protein [Candidatus Margulisbacteria bacterium]|nr:tetratricopeptide repeat protein [Candidatus Margulisiibacteriota bacterium]